jgi:hypothetical protein
MRCCLPAARSPEGLLSPLRLEKLVPRPISLRSTTGFDAFLYALVGQDNNGLPLSVLSALARRDVDPWEEAAKLSVLPQDSAIVHLVSLLGALPPDASGSQDATRTATRLVALLPPRHGPPPTARRTFTAAVTGEHSVITRFAIGTFLIYIVVTLFGG